MSRHAKLWAIRRRRELLDELGGKCVHCGETDYEKLTFDHKDGKDWSARGKSTDQRMCRYIREHRLGNIQILCGKCNAIKGDPLNPDEEERLAIDLPGVGEWYADRLVITENSPF